MNKKGNIHNQKHLTLTDRIYIEQELLQGSTFKSIAQTLHKDPTTISKEIKTNSILHHTKKPFRQCKSCVHYKECRKQNVCGDYKCISACRMCIRGNPTINCHLFLPYEIYCHKKSKPPYVCNGCNFRHRCTLDQFYYKAKEAQDKYEHRISSNRKGINMTPDELRELNDLISPLILKGQPLSHIFSVHKNEIPVCRRTLYNYLDQRIFQARNIDLPRRVRYKKRKKKSALRSGRSLQQVYRNKRTYIDFERFMEAHPDFDVV